MLVDAGNLHNLRLAANSADGGYRGPVFMDSDVYRIGPQHQESQEWCGTKCCPTGVVPSREWSL
jgi:hypothetical protein